MQDAAEETEQLWLFPELAGGIDMAKLRAKRKRLTDAGTCAPNTVEGYGLDWKAFRAWCERAGKIALPATSETVSLYTVWALEEAGLKSSTVSRHLAAIAWQHRRAHQAVPVDKTVHQLVTAVRRERKEKRVGKAALSAEDLGRACLACDISGPCGVRDRAVLVLGFATGLRRSELSALNVADVLFETAGLAVRVAHSKTDQEGKGRLVGVFAGERPQTDPVRTLRAWLTMRGGEAGPLFTRVRLLGKVTGERLSENAFNLIVKAAVKRIGLDASTYGAHSLRAGLVTAAAEIGSSDEEIMIASGHKDIEVMRDYIRSQRLFQRRNPLAGVL